MRASRHNQFARDVPIPLLGLILVAAFLGHDTLMAAARLATPHAGGQMAQAHHMLSLEGLPPAEHLDNCGVGQSAVTPPDRDTGPALPPSAVVDTANHLCQAGGSAISRAWQEPRWPPGTFRALIQVYRI